MIPSDHFVRFYNEVFKYISAKGKAELEKYYDRVSKNQEYHCLDLFCQKGLADTRRTGEQEGGKRTLAFRVVCGKQFTFKNALHHLSNQA